VLFAPVSRPTITGKRFYSRVMAVPHFGHFCS
jgi:hypothetical protein